MGGDEGLDRSVGRRHVAVDDCGRILNPLLVTGQQHGGIAQGAAQALFEIVSWSMGKLLAGISPTSRHDGAMFTDADIMDRCAGNAARLAYADASGAGSTSAKCLGPSGSSDGVEEDLNKLISEGYEPILATGMIVCGKR